MMVAVVSRMNELSDTRHSFDRGKIFDEKSVHVEGITNCILDWEKEKKTDPGTRNPSSKTIYFFGK